MERSELDLHLLEFVQLLRQGGMPINLTEVQDALNGLLLIGMEDKLRVEGILQATLVKSPTQLSWFQEAFRAFFAAPDAKKAWQCEAQDNVQRWEEGMEQSRQELRFRGEELALTEEQRVAYMCLPEEEKERLRNFIERSEEGVKNGKPVDHTFQPLLERVMRGSLDYWRRKLGEDLPLSPPGSMGILSEVERAVRQKEIHYMTKDLKDIPPEEWPEVIKLIRRLSQRLASQLSRRRRRGKKGRLDIRRMVRDNLRYGGVMIHQRFKAPRAGRPRFLLLCDVSGSMLKYTEFILQFVYGLGSVVSGIEAYGFSDRLVELKISQRSGMSFNERTVEALQHALPEWGGGTNLAKALETLLAEHPFSFSHRTVLFILSDAQTLEGEKAAQHLKGIQKRVREIIWLNTLPERRWQETSKVGLFLPYCQMIECYTLKHLQAILSARLPSSNSH